MLTAEGRKRARDYKLEETQRWLRKDKSLRVLSVHQRGTLALLKIIAQQLYADIKTRGITLGDGSLNPSVEAFRKYTHEQIYALGVYMNVNRTHQAEPTDLAALMVQAEPVEVEPKPECEG
jgi:hypothetical protein